MSVTDKEKVLQKYPDAWPVWTSRGWRLVTESGAVVGRTDSAHVSEEDVWTATAKGLDDERQRQTS